MNALRILKHVEDDAIECLRCGRCSDHCASGLQPVRIAAAVKANDGDEMIDGNRNYYLSRSGAPIHISKLGTNIAEGTGMEVEGGLQVYLNNDDKAENDFTCRVEKGYDLSHGYGNGHTFFLDRPMQPTVFNVYQVLERMSNPTLGYTKFASMCKDLVYGANEDLLKKIFPEESKEDTWNTEKQKYAIYASSASTTGGRYTATGTNLIRLSTKVFRRSARSKLSVMKPTITLVAS